jgi:hypothetical protein
MSPLKFNMSFTTGGLFLRESLQLAAVYLDLHDWKLVVEEVINKNILQARTLSSLKRVCQEVISRLKTLNTEELRFLVEATHHEQCYLLWLAVCRRYTFIAEFAAEVIRERYITLKADLCYEDFDAFFNRKAEWHPEIDKISPSTRNKLRQVLFKILREADLLTSNNSINSVMLGPGLAGLIARGNPQEIRYYPVFETDVKGLLK